MKAIFSQEELKNEFSSPSFGGLKRELEKKFEQDGLVVCQFKLNGLSLNEKQEVEFSDLKVSDINQLEVLAEAPDQLLPAVIEGWLHELPFLIVQVDSLSKKMKFDGPEGQLKNFVDLVDSCSSLTDCLMAIEKTLIQDLETKTFWASNSLHMTETIQQLLAAFEKKDFVLLSEILEYDLAHGLQKWNETLGRIHAGVSAEKSESQP